VTNVVLNWEFLFKFHYLTWIVHRDELVNLERGYLVMYVGRWWRNWRPSVKRKVFNVPATAAEAMVPPMLPMTCAVATAISVIPFGGWRESGKPCLEENQMDLDIVGTRRDEV
jgi:hypothetical protein